MAKITVVGSANIDLVVRTPRMPVKGETILGGPFFSGCGGKGANQAVGAARLGGDVTIVARLGQDQFGDTAADNFRQEGIRLDCVFRSAEAHTGIASILVDGAGENLIVVASGANAELSPADVEVSADAIVAADVVLVQLESPMATVRRAVEIAHQAGVTVLLNPAPGQPLADALLRQVDVLTPNQIEAQIITGLAAGTPAEAEIAARALLEKGVGTVIITLGAAGALVVTAGGAEHVPGFTVDVVDTTGAGDAFSGALAVALSVRQPLAQAVTFANAVAALQVTRQGAAAAMPRRAEVEAFLMGVG